MVPTAKASLTWARFDIGAMRALLRERLLSQARLPTPQPPPQPPPQTRKSGWARKATARLLAYQEANASGAPLPQATRLQLPLPAKTRHHRAFAPHRPNGSSKTSGPSRQHREGVAHSGAGTGGGVSVPTPLSAAAAAAAPQPYRRYRRRGQGTIQEATGEWSSQLIDDPHLHQLAVSELADCLTNRDGLGESGHKAAVEAFCLSLRLCDLLDLDAVNLRGCSISSLLYDGVTVKVSECHQSL